MLVSCVKTNLCKYNYFYPAKSYEKPDYLTNAGTPNDADIVYDSIKNNGYNEPNILAGIGKILENADLLEKAKLFFEKRVDLLAKLNAETKDITSAGNDINRIEEKIFNRNFDLDMKG